jgi:competence protein ComEC
LTSDAPLDSALGPPRKAGPPAWAGPARLYACLLAERDRWPLWLPVLLGAGVALYFHLPLEPDPRAGVTLAVGLALAAWALRRYPGARLLVLALLALATGFALAQLRTAWIAAPVLERNWGPALLVAEVVSGEPQGRGSRLYLRPLDMPGLAETERPLLLRITLAGVAEPPAPGSRIRLRAALRPPSPPVLPGAFDFARQAYFQRLGGIGFAYGAGEVLPDATPPPQSLGQRWRLWWAGARQTITERIARQLDGQRGALAIALITGQRGAITEATREDMRNAGLAHLLAISGLHMGLVTGLLFYLLRAAMALTPGLALHRPIKKWAALGAAAGAFVYLNLVGASIPAQRAFLMILVVLLAVLLERRAISLRLVAWAAAVILVLAPDSLMSASFQMSFAAVTALIAAYEFWERRRPPRDGARDAGHRLAGYFLGVAATSVIAILATSPFAAFHFHRLALFGLLANLVAVPLTAFWIMPCAVLGLLLMPFGAESLGLVPMGWGLDVLLAVANTVAGWPQAVVRVPPMPDWGLGLVVLGGLWLCLWQGGWRWPAIAVVVAGALTPLTFQPPSLLASSDGRQAALRTPDGRLWVASQRGSRFVFDSWKRQAFAAEMTTWPRSGVAAENRLSCDPLGCLYREGETTLAVLLDPRAAEDCRLADVVLSLEPLRRQPCRDPTVVIDRFDLWREGAQAVWLEPEGPRVRSVAEDQGRRPWSPYWRRILRREEAGRDQ